MPSIHSTKTEIFKPLHPVYEGVTKAEDRADHLDDELCLLAYTLNAKIKKGDQENHKYLLSLIDSMDKLSSRLPPNAESKSDISKPEEMDKFIEIFNYLRRVDGGANSESFKVNSTPDGNGGFTHALTVHAPKNGGKENELLLSFTFNSKLVDELKLTKAVAPCLRFAKEFEAREALSSSFAKVSSRLDSSGLTVPDKDKVNQENLANFQNMMEDIDDKQLPLERTLAEKIQIAFYFIAATAGGIGVPTFQLFPIVSLGFLAIALIAGGLGFTMNLFTPNRENENEDQGEAVIEAEYVAPRQPMQFIGSSAVA